MPESAVLFELRDRVALITLNRPGNRNSMDDELPAAFRATLEKLNDTADIRCTVITGSGNTFCSGADLKSNLVKNLFADNSILPSEAVSKKIYAPFLGVLDLEMPVIAAMNGHAVGGGLGLGLLCDIRVANKSAKYGANFVRLGYTSGLAISYVLPRLIGVAAAAELLFTGRLISGELAERIGLVNYAVEESKVLDQALSLANEIAEAAPIAIRAMKQNIYRGLAWDPRSHLVLEAHNMSATLDTADAQEGVQSLLEKRSPKFTGK